MKIQSSVNLIETKPKQSQWILLAVVLVICTILAIFGDKAREMLRYESNLLTEYDYWRLLTSHFVHLGWSHFALNMLGFFVLWLIYGGVYSAKSWMAILCIATLGISLCFLQFDKDLNWYLGFSGVLHALFTVVLVYLLLQRVLLDKSVFYLEDAILLTFLILKLTYEQLVGAVPFTESGSGGPVVVNAHFYGAIIGCIWALFLFKFNNSEVSK